MVAATQRQRLPAAPTVDQTTSARGIDMLLPHQTALARARMYVAALADTARSRDAASTYGRTLLYLDAIHGDAVPIWIPVDEIEDRTVLVSLAETAVEGLVGHGIDALQVELVLAMLEDARELEHHG